MNFESTRTTPALVALAVIALTGCGAGSANESPRDATEEYYRSPDEALYGQSSSEDVAPSGSDADGRRQAPPVLVRRPPSSRGSLDGDAAGQVIFESSDRLDQCYAGVDEAAGRGVVYVIFDVSARGEVGGVLVGHSDIEDSGFLECLEHGLRSLQMPASSGDSTVQAYLVFGARDQTDGRAMLRAYRASRPSSSETAEAAVPLTEIRRSVQGCYERSFRGRGTEVGRLVLRLTVDDVGRVSDVDVIEDNLEGRLDACVRDVVGKLTLDLDEGAGPIVEYPVIITPGAQVEPSGGAGA